MSLRRRFTLVYLLLATAVALDCVIGGCVVVALRDARDEHGAVRDATAVAASLQTNLIGQAASIRSYFLDTDTRSFDDYSTARAGANNITAELERLVPSAASPAIQRVTQAALTWRTSAINPLIATEQRGAPADVIRDYAAGNAVPLFKDATDELTKLKSVLATAERGANRREHVASIHVFEFALATLAFLALSYALVVLAAKRWFANPTGDLQQDLDEARRAQSSIGRHADALRGFRGHHSAANQSPDWDVATELIVAKTAWPPTALTSRPHAARSSLSLWMRCYKAARRPRCACGHER